MTETGHPKIWQRPDKIDKFGSLLEHIFYKYEIACERPCLSASAYLYRGQIPFSTQYSYSSIPVLTSSLAHNRKKQTRRELKSNLPYPTRPSVAAAPYSKTRHLPISYGNTPWTGAASSLVFWFPISLAEPGRRYRRPRFRRKVCSYGICSALLTKRTQKSAL